ncbi:MAG TPA: hypothetical protein VKY40_01515 [Halanaerobiales bacterium]|nr:hypothetical protein [Halanaerobiales bacterium]
MEKKWVYNLGMVLLILGTLIFVVSIVSLFIRGFLAGFNDLSVENYSGFGVDYIKDGFMLLVIGLLLVGFNRVLNRLE